MKYLHQLCKQSTVKSELDLNMIRENSLKDRHTVNLDDLIICFVILAIGYSTSVFILFFELRKTLFNIVKKNYS